MTRFETRSPDWLSVGEALDRVLGRAKPLETERVLFGRKPGSGPSRWRFARATLPPWDNSAMDGYAVRHADLLQASSSSPIRLKVVGEIRAGGSTGPTVGPGEAIRIMTGAPVPSGADAIVRVEDTDAEAEPGEIQSFSGPGAGKDIRPGGQDMLEGERGPGSRNDRGCRANRPPGRNWGGDRAGPPEAHGWPFSPTATKSSRHPNSIGSWPGRPSRKPTAPPFRLPCEGAGGIPSPLGIAKDNPGKHPRESGSGPFREGGCPGHLRGRLHGRVRSLQAGPGRGGLRVGLLAGENAPRNPLLLRLPPRRGQEPPPCPFLACRGTRLRASSPSRSSAGPSFSAWPDMEESTALSSWPEPVRPFDSPRLSPIFSGSGSPKMLFPPWPSSRLPNFGPCPGQGLAHGLAVVPEGTEGDTGGRRYPSGPPGRLRHWWGVRQGTFPE